MTKKSTPEKDIRYTFQYMMESLGTPELDGIDVGRLQRALPLALSSDPLTKYKTNWEICECPDQAYRMNVVCKHRIAYMLRRRDKVVLLIFSGQKLIDSKETYE